MYTTYTATVPVYRRNRLRRGYSAFLRRPPTPRQCNNVDNGDGNFLIKITAPRGPYEYSGTRVYAVVWMWRPTDELPTKMTFGILYAHKELILRERAHVGRRLNRVPITGFSGPRNAVMPAVRCIDFGISDGDSKIHNKIIYVRPVYRNVSRRFGSQKIPYIFYRFAMRYS